MLRIHFTGEDLSRIRVVARPDALWELALSLHRLQRRRPSGEPAPPVAGEVRHWRRSTVAHLTGRELGHRVRDQLFPLVPLSSYFPDFLTPYSGLLGLEPGLDTLLSTPRRRIGDELDRLASRSGTPSWGADLAVGRAPALHQLGDTLRGYFGAALTPVWAACRARVATEHTRLTGIGAEYDCEGLLHGLRPAAHWIAEDRVLVADYPVPLEIRLQGRGLTVIPSWFCSGTPVALADPALPPVLVYPLPHDPAPPADPAALAKLIGPTRARVLAAITTGTSTSLIQLRARISASQLSRHAAVLRDNNLITEARHAGHTFYTRTPLGNALVLGRSH